MPSYANSSRQGRNLPTWKASQRPSKRPSSPSPVRSKQHEHSPDRARFGAGIAEDRATPWDPYLRTLPAGLGPRVVARLLNGLTSRSWDRCRAVANVLLLPLAFGGGLFLPPELFPGWWTASTFLPSRAGRDLLVGTVTGNTIPLLSIAVLLAWTGLALELAVLAYRRDESQRFR